MNPSYYDIIIIGSGMAGLYSAYNIKKISPTTKFIVLEQHNKEWIGGRTSNETFYGTEIVTGAGIGRLQKDRLLYHLLQTLNIKIDTFDMNPTYSKLLEHVTDINKTIRHLKQEYKKQNKPSVTFAKFAKSVLGTKSYQNFLISAGYTDYENEDVSNTLNNYGMDDNIGGWKGFHVYWKEMVLRLADKIGQNNFKFSSNVVKLTKIQQEPCKFLLETDKNIKYYCNKVIIATTIKSIRTLLPKYTIYNSIEGQPFLRLYGKFSKSSIPILKEYVKGYMILPGPLQKIIPMDADKGVYMIAYNDNKNALLLKNFLENTECNRQIYCELLEQSLGMPSNSLYLIAIKSFYWPIGTHYYKPLDKKLFKNREEFIYKAQHPENGVLVVGEVVSNNQGWTEGALESVETTLSKKWILSEC